jgi:hypothetical protein
VIRSVHPIVAPAWPSGWEDVEVVDSVLVEDAPPFRATGAVGAARDDAGVYDRTGRVPAFRRFGRIVSVVA